MVDLLLDEESEKVEALFLRHKFQNHPFPWKLLSEAGWKYHSDPRYEAPTGQSFKTAKELVEFLDHEAIPDIFGNLQSVAQVQLEAAAEQKKLRRDLIELMHHQLIKQQHGSSKSDGVDGNDAQTLSSFSQTSTASDNQKTSLGRRTTRSRVASNDAGTSTIADKGTELYLNKATKHPKKSSRNQSSDSDQAISFPSLEQCRRAIKTHPTIEVEAIQSKLEENFDDWRFLLTTNHNILFFGAGSKRNLLQSFAEKSLSNEGYALIIDGFDKDVSIEAILDLFVKLFLDGEPESCHAVPQDDGSIPAAGLSNPWRAHPIVERAITISRAIAYHAMETLEPIFLVIHNIEATRLRTDVSQEALSALFINSRVANGTAAIRIVASIDDVDCAYKLWRLPIMTNFSWIWKEVHTYRAFEDEFGMLTYDDVKKQANPKSAQPGVISRTSKARVLDMLDSLAPKHAEVLQVLAQLQLEQMRLNEADCWVKYSEFRDRCKRKYIIGKDAHLAPLLSELNDHDLVQTNKESGNMDQISIPHDLTMLTKIVTYDLKRRTK